MTNHRVIKFLAGCGIATLLLSGCASNGDGPGLTEIKTPEQAQAASAIVISLFGDISGSIGMGAPALAGKLAGIPSSKIKALEANFAAIAKAPAPPVCDSGTRTITETFDIPAPGDYTYTETADNCVIGTTTTNGTRSRSRITDSAGYWIYSELYGNGNGIAEDGDYSVINTPAIGTPRIQLGDRNYRSRYHSTDNSASWSYNYSTVMKGEEKSIEGPDSFSIKQDLTSRGTESWDIPTFTFKDLYSVAGSAKLSITEGGEENSIAFSLQTTGEREDFEPGDDSGYSLNAPNGTLTINIIVPGYDCTNTNGSYEVKTITPIKEVDYDVDSDTSYALTAGKFVINGNTAVTFYGPGNPDNMTMVLDGVTEPPAYDGPIEILLDQENETCPLMFGR